MGSKGRLPPPSHLRQPLPGPDMLHQDPFGPGIRPPLGAFPFDILPPPEILERKFADQDVEMQRLFKENQRLAATHSVLRQELAATQRELQRLYDHTGAMKADQEQHMRGLLDKMAGMEAELKGSDTLKVELQQAHAEAQSLLDARQELLSKVQQLTQDLQKSQRDVQQVPALMSELDSLRQEYQHCRTTYDYERKLQSDHYESLQVMEKNYMSMVREVEKLRAELTNSTNVDKSGGSYGNSGGYKENDTAGQRSAGQNPYDDVYGVPQGRGPPGGSAATTYAGGPAEAAPTRPGYDAAASRGGAAYDASRNLSYDTSSVAAAGYDNSKGASTGHEAPIGGPGYGAANKGGAGAGRAPPTATNAAASYGPTQPASPYGSSQAQAPAPYGSAQAQNPYGSAQAPNPYGSSEVPNPYGTAHAPNPYGTAQAPNPYGTAQAPGRYGSARAPTPYGSTQAPTPYGSAQAPTPYGSAQAPPPYGSAQAPTSYGSAQAPNPYGSAQATPNPSGTSQIPNVAGTGYDAPPHGGGGGAMRR